MAYRIKASPDELRQTAKYVESANGDLTALQQQANGQVDFLQSHWKGEASSRFQASYGELRNVMSQVTNALNGVASSLNRAAEELQRAEVEARAQAARAFQRRG